MSDQNPLGSWMERLYISSYCTDTQKYQASILANSQLLDPHVHVGTHISRLTPFITMTSHHDMNLLDAPQVSTCRTQPGIRVLGVQFNDAVLRWAAHFSDILLRCGYA